MAAEREAEQALPDSEAQEKEGTGAEEEEGGRVNEEEALASQEGSASSVSEEAESLEGWFLLQRTRHGTREHLSAVVQSQG